ncbi:MAG: hypothetical protein ACE5HK_07360, partial [Candidatus Methylomirabilales bacterium]
MDERPIARTKHAELTLDQLAEIQPGMSRLMVEVSHRFTLLYHAAKGGNWDLAYHEWRQLRGMLKIIGTVRPKYVAELKAYDDGSLLPLEGPIRARDWPAFREAAERAVAESDAVHA